MRRLGVGALSDADAQLARFQGQTAQAPWALITVLSEHLHDVHRAIPRVEHVGATATDNVVHVAPLPSAVFNAIASDGDCERAQGDPQGVEFVLGELAQGEEVA